MPDLAPAIWITGRPKTSLPKSITAYTPSPAAVRSVAERLSATRRFEGSPMDAAVGGRCTSVASRSATSRSALAAPDSLGMDFQLTAVPSRDGEPVTIPNSGGNDSSKPVQFAPGRSALGNGPAASNGGPPSAPEVWSRGQKGSP